MGQMDGTGKDVILQGARTRPINSVRGSGLYARRRTLPPTAPPPEDEVQELAKGIFLAVVDALPDYAAKALEPHIHELETRSAALVGKLLQQEFAVRDEVYRKELIDLESKFIRTMDQLGERVDAMSKAYSQGTDRIETILKALPVPSVTVPVDAIRIEQKASVVNFTPQVNVPTPIVNVKQADAPIINLPKDAISVNVKSEASIVQIPKDALRVEVKQVPSIVNFAVPEKSLVLEVPKPITKTVTKSIVYGQDGRPSQIVEETKE